jgi:predicted DNA-binding ribbon-helix-helix protein
MNAAMLRKISLSIRGHRTSLALEEAFWKQLRRIAQERGCSLAVLITEIDESRSGHSLASSLRLFVLEVLEKNVTVSQ